VRGVRAVACELQGVISFDSAAYVQLAAVIQGPAAVLGLGGAQVAADLGFQRRVDLVQEVHHHDVFGRHGAVRFELEQPMTLRILPCDQRIPGIGNRAIQG
jgi:hypothetical protein